MKLETALRLALVVLLAGLGVAPVWRDAPRSVPVVRFGAPLTEAVLARLLATPPAAVVRAAADPPSAAELDRLRAAASLAPLIVALPGAATIEVAAPAAPRVGRSAAVSFTLRGAPLDSVRLRLTDALGPLDSARVALDSAGAARGAFRIRPTRPGWQRWTVEAGTARAVAGAWVDSGGPPRVRVHAGMPGWESKFVVRALEESGARVGVRYELGRGMTVGDGGLTDAVLAATDAVIVLDGAPLPADQARRLAAWADAGGGVLLAGDRAAATPFGVVRGAAPALPVDAAALTWRLPAELSGLPAPTLRATAAPLRGIPPGTRVLATGPAGDILAARPVGAGRLLALGVLDSWRWRLEAGRVAEHREFWRSLVDHLASAPTDPVLAVRPALPAPGTVVEITAWRRGDGPPIDRARVETPAGGREVVPLREDADGVRRGRYVAARPGVYRITAAGATAGFEADGAVTAPGAWARLALVATGSGGAAVPSDSLAPVLARRVASPGSAVPRVPPGAWLALAALLAGATWALRRRRGEP